MAVRQLQHGMECTATRFVEERLMKIRVLPAVLTFAAWQPGPLERREVYRDHQDRTSSKRDEIQLVMRQGPACLAIASYSVKK